MKAAEAITLELGEPKYGTNKMLRWKSTPGMAVNVQVDTQRWNIWLPWTETLLVPHFATVHQSGGKHSNLSPELKHGIVVRLQPETNADRAAAVQLVLRLWQSGVSRCERSYFASTSTIARSPNRATMSSSPPSALTSRRSVLS